MIWPVCVLDWVNIILTAGQGISLRLNGALLVIHEQSTDWHRQPARSARRICEHSQDTLPAGDWLTPDDDLDCLYSRLRTLPPAADTTVGQSAARGLGAGTYAGTKLLLGLTVAGNRRQSPSVGRQYCRITRAR